MWIKKGSRKQYEEKRQNESLQWEDRMVLAPQSVNMLHHRMAEHLSFREFGFGVLDESVYRQFVQRQLGGLQTVNGDALNGRKMVDHSVELLRQIRSHKMIHHQRDNHQNTRRQMNHIMKAYRFRQSFDLEAGWKDTKKFMKQDVSLWIAMCNDNEVPPYMLLVEWLKRKKVFSKNKEVTTFIRGDAKKGDSFHWFCRVIAESDESSFLFEVDKRDRAEHLEQIGFRKVRQLLLAKGIRTKMYSEDDLKQREEYLDGTNKLTPDILFSEGVVINGQTVHWMDMKNYFVTPRDGMMWKKLKQTCSKYTKVLRSGAIVCKGFDSGARIPCHTLLLDAFTDLLGDESDNEDIGDEPPRKRIKRDDPNKNHK